MGHRISNPIALARRAIIGGAARVAAIVDSIGAAIAHATLDVLEGRDANVAFIEGPFAFKYHTPRCQRIQRVISTATDIVAGMKVAASLTHQYVAGFNKLTAESLHAEAFGF